MMKEETPIQNIGQGIGKQGTLCIHPVQSLQNVEMKNTFFGYGSSPKFNLYCLIYIRKIPV